MSGTSSKSQVVAIRLPNEVVELIRERSEARGYSNLADYLRPRIIADLTRKHKRNEASERGSESFQAMPEITKLPPMTTTDFDIPITGD